MIKEYGDIKDGDMARCTTLATIGRYRLTHSTAGYEIAGSCARSTDEKWGVCRITGTYPYSTQWFETKNEATAAMAKWNNV